MSRPDLHRVREFTGDSLDSRDDVSRVGDYLFSLTSVSRQGSRREKLAIIHQPDLSAARSGEVRMAMLHVVGCRYTYCVAERPFLGGLRALMNLRSAFDELSFIELSSPHETVISQWNYGSPFSRSPTAAAGDHTNFAGGILRIYSHDVNAYPSLRRIIMVIISVTVTMIVMVVTVLAAIKGAYYGHPSLRMIRPWIFTLHFGALELRREYPIPRWNRILLKQNSVQIKRLSTRSLIRKLWNLESRLEKLIRKPRNPENGKKSSLL